MPPPALQPPPADSDSGPPVTRPVLVALATLVALGVLILDALAEPHTAVAMLYSVAVLVLSFTRRPNWTATGCVVCLVCMILSAALWPPGVRWESQSQNLLLSACLVVLVTAVSIRGTQIVLQRDQVLKAHAQTLRELRLLHGALNSCAWCKRIHEGHGEWITLEEYIERHTDTGFTHGICPQCSRERFGVEMKRAQ